MHTIEASLGDAPEIARTYTLRGHRAGDMGWVIQRHGILYRQEYGWDERFEALVARIAADFIDNFDPERERCRIAERNGDPMGCVFVLKHAEEPEVARLRLLLVESNARRMGLARLLRMNALDSPGRQATGRSLSGRTVCSLRHAVFTRARGMVWSKSRRTEALATI